MNPIIGNVVAKQNNNTLKTNARGMHEEFNAAETKFRFASTNMSGRRVCHAECAFDFESLISIWKNLWSLRQTDTHPQAHTHTHSHTSRVIISGTISVQIAKQSESNTPDTTQFRTTSNVLVSWGGNERCTRENACTHVSIYEVSNN